MHICSYVWRLYCRRVSNLCSRCNRLLSFVISSQLSLSWGCSKEHPLPPGGDRFFRSNCLKTESWSLFCKRGLYIHCSFVKESWQVRKPTNPCQPVDNLNPQSHPQSLMCNTWPLLLFLLLLLPLLFEHCRLYGAVVLSKKKMILSFNLHVSSGERYCSVLQCVALCCTALHCVAVCCSTRMCFESACAKWKSRKLEREHTLARAYICTLSPSRVLSLSRARALKHTHTHTEN